MRRIIIQVLATPETGDDECHYNLDMELAKEIRQRMKALNMTQADLAELSGVHQSRISDALSKRSLGATEATLNKLLAALKAHSIKWGTVEGYPKERLKRVPPRRKAK